MIKTTKRRLMTGRLWLVMLLLLTGSMTGYAQSDCFDYEDEGKTITGLTAKGLAATSLTIPATVTKVKSGAFNYSSAKVSALVIEDGGNPAFASGLFGELANPLGDIQIMGSSMTVENIKALFTSLGAQGALSTVYIEGYSGEWSDIAETGVLTADVSVALPAALVTDQQFGNAKVYGRFEITKEIITFCGNVTFLDATGSNMLFYVAAYKAEDGRLHIRRVEYIAKGKGVLIHNLENTSSYADLERISTDTYTGTDASLYEANMLVGVTTPTEIGNTDGTMTNYILKDGAFHPTSGTVKANKAYLQLPTSVAPARALTIDFDEEGTSLTPTLPTSLKLEGSNYYDLQGRRVASAEANSSLFTLHSSLKKGFYINNGKKYVIR